MHKKLLTLICVFLFSSLLAACTITDTPPAEPASASIMDDAAVTHEFPDDNTKLKNIVILATGGTIAGTGDEGSTTGYSADKLDVEDIIESVTGLRELANLSGEQIVNVPSDDVAGQDWLALTKRINELAASDNIDGFVITHGTDTLEETAYFLHLTLKTNKPVVMTGSMRPLTASSADGPQNLYQAVALARSDEAAGKGMRVVFSDAIYSAREVTKVSTFRTDAFNSRDLGCLRYMRDDVAFSYQESLPMHTTQTPFDVANIETLPEVGIVCFHIDADSGVLDYMFERYEGVVLAGAGNGGSSTLWNERAKELTRATGVPFVRSSRIANGIVDDTDDETIAAGTLNPQKARILLQLSLTLTQDKEEIAEFFTLY